MLERFSFRLVLVVILGFGLPTEIAGIPLRRRATSVDRFLIQGHRAELVPLTIRKASVEAAGKLDQDTAGKLDYLLESGIMLAVGHETCGTERAVKLDVQSRSLDTPSMNCEGSAAKRGRPSRIVTGKSSSQFARARSIVEALRLKNASRLICEVKEMRLNER